MPRAGGSTMTRGSGRAIVTVSGLDPEGATVSEAEWLLRDHGLRALTIDTSIEDSFADVHDLLLDVDVADADVVISLGGRSATALAIAVLCDVPMSVCGSLDARRLEAVQQAVSGGSELHRSVPRRRRRRHPSLHLRRSGGHRVSAVGRHHHRPCRRTNDQRRTASSGWTGAAVVGSPVGGLLALAGVRYRSGADRRCTRGQPHRARRTRTTVSPARRPGSSSPSS